MGKYTPGPWKPHPLNFGEYEIGAGNDEIALVYANNGGDEPRDFPSEANARLIAAAPDLLAALLAAPDFGGTPTTVFGRKYREWQNIARAAIAKATGETV